MTLKTADISEEARALHGRALVWDMVWPLEPICGNVYATLERFKPAGHDVLSMSIAGDNHNISEAVQRIADVRKTLRKIDDCAVLCESVDDILSARSADKLAVLMHLEGLRCLDRNLDMIEVYYKLGVRHSLIAFNNANSAGGGCMEDEDAGLSALGRKMVAEMQRVGMLIDLSHTGHKTALQTMEIASVPCVYTHSNAGALFPHPRNVSDEEIRAVAQTGGLVGLATSSMYHDDPLCRAENLFRHLDRMVEIAGADHVGLGLDIIFDSGPVTSYMRARPEEWPEAADPDWRGVNTITLEEAPRLTQCMLDAGYPEEAILNILGGNYLRICRKVWN